jgi:hypothetical protein
LLIQKKMFTYFYNKFSPVNHMRYIKCGVNSSLHNVGFCRKYLAPCIAVLSQRTLFTTRVIYKFTFVWNSSKEGTAHSPTSHQAHLYTVPFIWLPRGHRPLRSWFDDFAGRCLFWRLESKHFLRPHLVFKPMGGGGAILAVSGFLNQIPHQK